MNLNAKANTNGSSSLMRHLLWASLVLLTVPASPGGVQVAEAGESAMRPAELRQDQEARYAPQGLFVFRERARCGYVDGSGDVVLRAEFESAGPFSEGLAAVVKGGRFHYIDSRGRIVFSLPPGFVEAHPFSEGRAVVGRFVQSQGGQGPGESGSVRSSTPCHGLVDTEGRFVVPCTYDWIAPFSEGVAAAMKVQAAETEPRVGFLGRDGQWAIKPQYVSADSFSEGLAPVKVGLPGPQQAQTKNEGAWGFINRDGALVISASFTDVAGGFSDGLACVEKGSRWGYIDKRGDFTIPPRFARAGPMSEGMAAVWQQPYWGFIDRHGKLRIKYEYLDCRSFSEGMAGVKVKGKWGFIDHAGSMVIAPRFRAVEPFTSGLARVRFADGTFGYVNLQGEFVWREKPRPPKSSKEVQEDDAIGLTEEDVIRKYGKPHNISRFRLGEHRNPFRMALLEYLPPSKRADVIKQYFYGYETGERRWFWFIANEEGAWTVFSNVYCPPGIEF